MRHYMAIQQENKEAVNKNFMCRWGLKMVVGGSQTNLRVGAGASDKNYFIIKVGVQTGGQFELLFNSQLDDAELCPLI